LALEQIRLPLINTSSLDHQTISTLVTRITE
jgi:hypothetical protein